MYNSVSIKKRSSTPARDITTFWAWRGYGDRLDGLDFCAEYDTLSPANQRNYERGRQIAAVIVANYGAGPKWKKSEMLATMGRRLGGWALEYRLNDDVFTLFFPPRAA